MTHIAHCTRGRGEGERCLAPFSPHSKSIASGPNLVARLTMSDDSQASNSKSHLGCPAALRVRARATRENTRGSPAGKSLGLPKKNLYSVKQHVPRIRYGLDGIREQTDLYGAKFARRFVRSLSLISSDLGFTRDVLRERARFTRFPTDGGLHRGRRNDEERKDEER